LGGDVVPIDFPIEWPELPGSDAERIVKLSPTNAPSTVWILLSANVTQRRIQVLYNTPGKQLIQNPQTHEIVGIQAETEGVLSYIKANKAVILTCGGFNNNQDMIRNYMKDYVYCYPKGTPYNTGDGVQMALAVGADLWHMSVLAGPLYGFKPPNRDFTQSGQNFPGNNYIYVGPDGTRFTDETQSNRHGAIDFHGSWSAQPTPIGNYPLPPATMYWILDNATMSKGPLYMYSGSGWSDLVDVYTWSKDNSAEITAGWITQASSISALAAAIGLDANVLSQTITTYNGYCAAGKDPDFGRNPSTMAPITTPPYSALPLVPEAYCTRGGPRRNEFGQILDGLGNPIPRLYEAGELGSLDSFNAYVGTAIGEDLVYGRISGANAATESPWS
jgi:succinate dehydrogenase/fumarate reductase flavoprotein subunit